MRSDKTEKYPDSYAILAIPEIFPNKIVINNIRDFRYRAEFDFDKNYYRAVFLPEQIESATLSIVPFTRNPFVAHFLILFKFYDEQEIVFSVEVRYKAEEKFSILKTLFGDYQLIYIIAARSDAIELREKHRSDEPNHYYFKLNLDSARLQNLFEGMATRAALVNTSPERFNLFFNSCSSNIVNHLNMVLPNKIPIFYKYFAPRMLARYLRKHKIISD